MYMATFTIGEEVLHDGERFVITLSQPSAPYRYRLVRTTAQGPELTWAEEHELQKIERYTEPKNDTPAV